METSGLDIRKLTIDDIINAMRVNGIKTIDVCTEHSTRDAEDDYIATVTEWYGAVTRINPHGL